MSQREAISGWALTRNASAALAAAFAIRYLAAAGGEESIRAVVRLTAQTSVVLFVAAFAASSLRVVWKSEATAWLLKNRRYVGVTFAFSHLVHLFALIALGRVSQEFVDSLNATTLIGGGLGFVFIGLLAATSSNRAVATLGAANWRRLHKVGVYYIWVIFFQSYLPRALFTSPVYWLPTGLLLAGFGLRIYAWQRARAATRIAPGFERSR